MPSPQARQISRRTARRACFQHWTRAADRRGGEDPRCCYDFFGNDRVRVVRDLNGKMIAISSYSSADAILLSSILAYVGIDPRTDVQWLSVPMRWMRCACSPKGKPTPWALLRSRRSCAPARSGGHPEHGGWTDRGHSTIVLAHGTPRVRDQVPCRDETGPAAFSRRRLARRHPSKPLACRRERLRAALRHCDRGAVEPPVRPLARGASQDTLRFSRLAAGRGGLSNRPGCSRKARTGAFSAGSGGK